MSVVVPERVFLADAEAGASAAEAVAQIPDDIRERLSAEQVMRLAKLVSGAPRSEHAIAYRVSTRLFGRPIYLAFFTGEELRSSARISDDGHRRSPSLLLLKITMFCMWWAMTAGLVIVSAVIVLYVVKSVLGIDLFPGPSVLHYWVFD
ncbi:MAG: hypothetical protein ABL898_16800 [Hyphomicrobiaceae bacterium]|nr:hypothetical protein [Hyphomicrobiaceae bacterium]